MATWDGTNDQGSAVSSGVYFYEARTGGEAMMEPMNAADRKVIHDAAAEFDGVKTYSEGEDPRRAVVIASTGDVSSD